MRADVERRFQEDLAEANRSEIGRLTESNLRNNLERQWDRGDEVSTEDLRIARHGGDFQRFDPLSVRPARRQVERQQRCRRFVFLRDAADTDPRE